MAQTKVITSSASMCGDSTAFVTLGVRTGGGYSSISSIGQKCSRNVFRGTAGVLHRRSAVIRMQDASAENTAKPSAELDSSATQTVETPPSVDASSSADFKSIDSTAPADSVFSSVSLQDLLNEEDEEDFVGEVPELEPPKWYTNKLAIEKARQQFRQHDKDTGSAEYQIATLTTRILYLTEHAKRNPKDHASTRGLVKLVGQRRRFLRYLKKEDRTRFDNIIAGLNIRVSRSLRGL